MPRLALPAAGVAATLALLLSGCGTTADTPGQPSNTTTLSSSTTIPSSPTTPADDSSVTSEDTVIPPSDTAPSGSIGAPLPTGGVTEEVMAMPSVQDAVQDLAKREDETAGEVTVVGFAEVTWRDGSLGCPQSGRMYTQALVPGQQLVLQVGDQQFAYHAAQGKAFFYCADPKPGLPSSSTT